MTYKERRYLDLWTRLVALLVMGLVYAAPLSAATRDWAGKVQEALYNSQLQTLQGRVFLDYPIGGATVKIHDRSGVLLHSDAMATGNDGSFSITGNFPAAFWIVIEAGLKEGEPFDHEMKSYVPEFREGKRHKVNAITTLMAKYQELHPQSSYEEVKAVVAGFLGIPDTVDVIDVNNCTNTDCFNFYFSKLIFYEGSRGCWRADPFHQPAHG